MIFTLHKVALVKVYEKVSKLSKKNQIVKGRFISKRIHLRLILVSKIVAKHRGLQHENIYTY